MSATTVTRAVPTPAVAGGSRDPVDRRELAAIARATSEPFWAIFKLPSILADAGIALVLWWGLRLLGSSRTQRLIAVALVALGPSFVLISGYHGQIDAVAALPALAAVIVWQRGGENRALEAGALIGLAAAIKTVPLFMVLALRPTARSRREVAVLVFTSLIIPLVSLAPFLIADTHVTIHGLTTSKGVPGYGELSLLQQPHLPGYQYFVWGSRSSC